MIHIDGAQKSGSGTIVRYAVGLAVLLGQDLRLTNIRAKRDKPGLRPQHLKAIQAVADLCRGRIEGAKVGSSEIVFRPGRAVEGGRFEWDIGTAGSTTMLALSILPLAYLIPRGLSCRITGGVFQDFAPSAYHVQRVLLPSLAKMGLVARLDVVRPGYVPRGGGVVELHVEPVRGKLRPLELPEQGRPTVLEGIAIASHLGQRQVARRMAAECQAALQSKGLGASIEEIDDATALQRGAALALFAHSDTGCILGADRAGAPGRTSEEIGRHVAHSLLEDLASGATVDRHLADQLILAAALAEGTTRYRIPRLTDHVESNLWLVESILGAKTRLTHGPALEVDGIGYAGRRN